MKIPLELRWLKAHGFSWLTPWHFEELAENLGGLRSEFRIETSGGSQPERDVYPFATRQDQDEFAGFAIENGEIKPTVLVVHLTWAGSEEQPGFPTIVRYPTIWDWLKTVIDDTVEWVTEGELAEIEEDEALDRMLKSQSHLLSADGSERNARSVQRALQSDERIVRAPRTGTEKNADGFWAESETEAILLNDVGAFIWSQIRSPKTELQLLEAILNVYDIDETTASTNLHNFLRDLLVRGFAHRLTVAP